MSAGGPAAIARWLFLRIGNVRCMSAGGPSADGCGLDQIVVKVAVKVVLVVNFVHMGVLT